VRCRGLMAGAPATRSLAIVTTKIAGRGVWRLHRWSWTDRELVVIEGNGMVLAVDGESIECLPGQVVRFSGDSTTFARLVDGPVVDLGLMTVRGSVAGSMSIVADVGDNLGSRVVVALSEKVEIGVEGFSHVLDRLDAVIQKDGSAMCLISGVVACLVVI